MISTQVVKHFNVDRSDFLQYAVPGFVFFAQNNLSFLALQHMNSSAFQLLMNTRIVSVAILAVVMLGKRMHALEWTSIVLLMVGAMQYQLSGCGDDGYKIDTMGLCVMAVIVACAAGGNVYTQKVMQRWGDSIPRSSSAAIHSGKGERGVPAGTRHSTWIDQG